jgi:hypothetical protein
MTVLLLLFVLLSGCVHYAVSGNFPSKHSSNKSCVQASKNQKQQCQEEIKCIKQSIAKASEGQHDG